MQTSLFLTICAGFMALVSIYLPCRLQFIAMDWPQEYYGIQDRALNGIIRSMIASLFGHVLLLSAVFPALIVGIGVDYTFSYPFDNLFIYLSNMSIVALSCGFVVGISVRERIDFGGRKLDKWDVEFVKRANRKILLASLSASVVYAFFTYIMIISTIPSYWYIVIFLTIPPILSFLCAFGIGCSDK